MLLREGVAWQAAADEAVVVLVAYEALVVLVGTYDVSFVHVA